MSPHRLVAVLSLTALVGLMGFASRADASSFAPPAMTKPVSGAKTTIVKRETIENVREKVQKADVDGCGGSASASSPLAHVPSFDW